MHSLILENKLIICNVINTNNILKSNIKLIDFRFSLEFIICFALNKFLVINYKIGNEVSTMRSMKSIIIFSLIFFKIIVANAQESQNNILQEKYRFNIRNTSENILVDGELSEEVWKNTEIISDFWMSYPVDDRKVEKGLQTEVMMTHNDQYIYIGVICHGDDDYIIQTLKRDTDFNKGDGFGIVIDPVNERTNAFTFGVSPAGVQTELLITAQTGRRETLEPGRVPQGTNMAWDNKWFSEVKNFPEKWTIEIAIPFKTLRFKNTKKTWGINFFRLDAKTNSIHTWSPVPIEFMEFDLGYTGALVWENPPQKAKTNISLIPYVLGSTSKDYETNERRENDFQAGVDGKVAITSSLNFDVTINPDFSQVEVDEQITNLTLFDIRLPEKRLFFLENSDIFEDFGIPPMRPFFSRKIGLDDDGIPIPIIYGARLSGNINNDLRVGLMNMQTRKTDEFLAQNYTSVALHQQVLSRSIIKGYFHNRAALNSPNADFNRNMGLEFLYRSSDGRFQSFAGGGKSFSPGLTSKSYFYNLAVGYDNRNISVYTNLAGIGNNYRADMGFIMGQEYYDASRDTTVYIGYHHWFTRFNYTLYMNTSKIIYHKFGGRYIWDVDSAFSSINSEAELNYELSFTNTGKINATYNHTTLDLLFPFSFIDGEPLPAGIYTYDYGEILYDSDQRKRFIFKGGIQYGSFYNGTRTRYILGLKYRAQPWGNFEINIENNDLRFPDPYGKDNLLLISPRIEINFSKSIFWTTFLQYNTQNDNFNINSRLQWRFKPMSDVYLVYTDNYAVEFWGVKNRAVVLKINYWLNL